MIDLTKDQQNALDYILENDWDVFILTGNAGTGKSTLLEIIQKSFKKNKFEVYPGAFTGRAAAVLRQKGLSNARTIHYYLYGRPTLYVEFKKFFKLVRLKITRKLQDNELWIIDESSMLDENLLTLLINHVHNPQKELGRFGQKLQQIFAENNYEIDSKKKIIFCGDPNQLRPIFGNAMPALNQDSFNEKLKVKSFELTTLIRHQENPGIQSAAMHIEENKRRLVSSNLVKNDSIEYLQNFDTDAIVDKYLELYKKNPLQIKYLSYLNQVVHEFNLYIRTKIHNIDPRVKLVKDDLVHVTQNNYFYDLWNGDHLIVKEVGKSFEGPELKITCFKTDDKGNKILDANKDPIMTEKPISLSFTKIKISHTETGKSQELFCIDETLNNSRGDNWIFVKRDLIGYEITQYLKEFFFYRNPEFVGAKYDDFKKERETDLYNNALFLNYSYAITGHKAQGGEWNYVMVDLEKSGRGFPKGWIYTAITRASKKAYIILGKR